MGCFSYICNGCNKSIRGEETAVLKHIRHGEVLGEAIGTYDSYGRVEENDVYRNDDKDNINSHQEICASEFDFLDSEGYSGRLYKEKPIQWMEYRQTKVAEGLEDLCEEIYTEWESLPRIVVDKPRSGVEAWHKYCYDRAPEEKKEKHIISKSDPNQSWGKPRKMYCE